MDAPSPTDPRFFTHSWTITLPTHPHLRFVREIPSNLASWFAVASLPENNETLNYPGQDPIWSDERISNATSRFNTRWAKHLVKYNALDVLVRSSATNEILGCGSCEEVMPGIANIGIELVVGARGKGVGKALMQVLLRLSNEVEVPEVHCGTMKANVAIRALAKSLGLVEKEEIVSMPGRGVVAELLWAHIERQRWKGLEMDVDFGEEVADQKDAQSGVV